MGVLKWVVGVPVVLFVLLALVRGPGKSNPEADRYSAIASECWKDYEKKSNDPQTKLLIAKTCEDFDAKAKSAR